LDRIDAVRRFIALRLVSTLLLPELILLPEFILVHGDESPDGINAVPTENRDYFFLGWQT
jgi:hypothetical protein